MRKLFATFTGAAFVFTAAAAWAAGMDGTGAVGTCATVGQVKIKPALVNGGTSPDALSVKTKPPKTFTAPCPGASGDGANVLDGKGKGSGTGTMNDCGALLGTVPSNIVLTVKWKSAKGTPKLNPSTITITSQTGSVSTTPANHGQFDVTGSVTSGSFSGDSVSATLITDQDITEILAACGDKGLKKITFGVKASKDDGQIGSGSFTVN